MYLAGLIADDARMTREVLQRWVNEAYAGGLAGSTVPSVAASGPHGTEMALRWIDSSKPLEAAAGWATLNCLVSILPDAELDQAELKRLLQRVQKSIKTAPRSRALSDERLCHCHRLLRCADDRVVSSDRGENRTGDSRPGHQ
jgi:hypothetical protein